MRRFLMVAGLAVALAACGSSVGKRTTEGGGRPIVFGISGGNIAPYSVSIQPNGSLRFRGSHQAARRGIEPARVRQLEREVQGAHLVSRRCPGGLPDFASHYIRLGDRTVTVRGACEPRFEQVWNELVRAVGLPSRS